MHEKLGKCTFQISPGAFFQVNTAGAENLYAVVVDKVKEVAKDPADTVLLDVCCGTGTIGMTCMKEGACGRVVGVDISIPAIDDAKINAELNGFTEAQTRFVASRAEHVLGEELKSLQGGTCSIVAVVDPAREGLHQDVAKTLRLNRGIQRIVYVSCNPTGSLVKDAGLLCAPPTKKYGGLPFVITSARPVDMFPLTDHCEMVLTFDRMSELEMKGEHNKPKAAKKEDNKPKEEDEKPKEDDEKPKGSTQGDETSKEVLADTDARKEEVKSEDVKPESKE
jgi:tRNA (uracil-5-)-methyltransferase